MVGEKSKKSHGFGAEADSARNRGTLVQATLDGTVPPKPFNQTQCANLDGSQNPVETLGWSRLIGSIQALAGLKPTETTGALGDSEGARRAAHMSVTHAERVIARDPTNGMPHSTAAYGLAFLGEQERARERIERALLISPDNMLMRYNFACILALKLNEPDRAIDLLEPVIRASSQSALKAFMADPDLDSLRDHPRLKRIIEFARAKLDFTSHPLAASEARLRS